MNKLIFKISLSAILWVFALSMANPISATETRLTSMGGVGFYTVDNSNMFFFPGTINKYPDLIVVELRTKNTQNSYSIGTHMAFNKDKVFGIYLNRPATIAPPPGLFDHVQLDKTTDIFAGLPYNDFDLGARLSVARDKYKQDSTLAIAGDEESTSYINLGIGVSKDNTDIGLYFESPSIKSDEDNGLTEKWSGSGYGFVARTFIGEKMQIVPVGIINKSSTTFKQTLNNTTTKVDYTASNMAVGVGLNFKPNEKALIVFGFEAIGISKLKTDIDQGTETTVTTTNFPGFYLGTESQINKWLTGRIGATQVYQSISTKTLPAGGTESELLERYKHFQITFGLGLVLNAFTLDFSFNEGLLFDGPNFISGTNETIANKISITYDF